jgi:hypothetical protein
LNLRCGSTDNVGGRGIFAINQLESLTMSKAARLASVSTIPASFVPFRADTKPSDISQFIPIALFSGMGLLVSLVAILCGVQGAWY